MRAALEVDAGARSPFAAARALDHKLGGPRSGRRCTAPSYELSRSGRSASVPGFNPVEAYEAAIANLAPELGRPPAATRIPKLHHAPGGTGRIVATA